MRPFEDLVDPVQNTEEQRPAFVHEAGATPVRQNESAWTDPQLFDGGVLRYRAAGLLRPDDAERYHDRPRPRGHVIDVEEGVPLGKQDQLRWDTRALRPLVLTKDRQIDLGEGVARIETAHGENHLSGLLHVWRLRVVADELEHEVGLDRSTQVRAATGVDGPATVGQLALAQIARGLAHLLPARATEKVHGQDVFRLENGVAFELGAPMAVLVLLAQQPATSLGDRLRQPAVLDFRDPLGNLCRQNTSSLLLLHFSPAYVSR